MKRYHRPSWKWQSTQTGSLSRLWWWAKVAEEIERVQPRVLVELALLERIAPRLSHFPGYARIRRVHASRTHWNVQDGLMTATLKLRRKQLLERYAGEIEKMYAGH